jgi:hypothetical protein
MLLLCLPLFLAFGAAVAAAVVVPCSLALPLLLHARAAGLAQ